MKLEQYVFEACKQAFIDVHFFNANIKHYAVFDKINTLIQEAWKKWDDDSTKDFWEGDEKQEFATESFGVNWLENYDFEADGWDIESLNTSLLEFKYLEI